LYPHPLPTRRSSDLYLTPVMYPASVLVNGGVGFLLYVNPLVPFLDLLRKPLVDCQVPDPMMYLLAALITAASCAAAGLALRSQEIGRASCRERGWV